MSAGTRLQRWRNDDWQVPLALRTPSGPLDLTGYQIGAEFTPGGYTVPSDLTIGNGGVDSLNAAAGTCRVVIPRRLTSHCPIDVDPTSTQSTFLRLYYLDANLRRQTFGIVLSSVYDGPIAPLIDETGAVVALWQDAAFTIALGLAQGPAGPSSITTAQITDASATGASLLKAPTAAAARGILGTIAVGATDVLDQDYVATPANFFVRVKALTASRKITLPDPATYPKGQTFKIADFPGACSPLLPIVVVAPADATVCGHQSFSLVYPYQRAELDHDGQGRWVLNTLLGQVGHYQYKKAINANTTTAAAGGVDGMMTFLSRQPGYRPGCDAANALYESPAQPGSDFELLVLYPWLEAVTAAGGVGLSATSTPTLADVQAELRDACLTYTAGGTSPASFFGFFG